MSARSQFRARLRVPSEYGFLGSLIDPIDRLSETIFSILILLTFTLAFRVIKLSGLPSDSMVAQNTDELVITAVSAIIAWGLIDGVMYALFSMFDRGERHRLLKEIQSAESEQEGIDAIAADLDYFLEPITDEDGRQRLYQSILFHLKDSQPRPIGFQRADLSGALGHLLVAVLAVLPSILPLVLLRDHFELAIRVSNIVSFVILFIAGYNWGKYTGANPWKTGLLLFAFAAAMVLIAIPLGG